MNKERRKAIRKKIKYRRRFRWLQVRTHLEGIINKIFTYIKLHHCHHCASKGIFYNFYLGQENEAINMQKNIGQIDEKPKNKTKGT